MVRDNIFSCHTDLVKNCRTGIAHRGDVHLPMSPTPPFQLMHPLPTIKPTEGYGYALLRLDGRNQWVPSP